MADWDVIAKQRLTEDWTTLRAAYLPLNQAMRRTVEFLEKGNGSFQEVLAVSRERLDGTVKSLTALCTRRSPWVRLEAIRRAHSHWQALAQCEEFLSSLRIEPVPVHDTAGAARMIADTGGDEDAAIASVEAGARFGLAVLAERIQSEKENFTKFAVIGSTEPGLGSNDKTSLVMAVLDQPGSLLGALQPLAARGINLHKLESRPMRGKPFEYVIYVDVMVAGDDPGLADALEEIAGHTSMLRVLGSYRAAPDPV